MLNSEVLDILMGRLGRRDSSVLRSVCLQEMNVAIRELERGPVKPWFMETTLEGNLVAEQDYITLPSAFLMEVEEGTFEVENEEERWCDLVKVTREKIRKETRNVDPAFPEGYAIWGNRMLFGPTPDQDYAYRLDCYQRTSAMVDNGSEVTNSWLLEAFDYIAYKTLIVVVRDHIREQTAATNFADAFRFAKDAFEREVTARQMTNQTLLLTDEEN